MLRAATIALLGAICASGCDRAAGIVVEDAWVRAAPPGVTVQAGYLTLRNPAWRAVTVVGARSDAFSRVEIHATRHRDGMTAMRRIERLGIPAGGHARLEPGVRHLMLIDPRRAFRAGERIDIVLVLADGREHGFAAEVRGNAP